MANLIMFAILAVVILGSAIICVTTKRIMRAATFLLFVLFGVAGLYFLLDYTYLGAAQISVYAGGVTMIYIFAIQLVSKRTLQGLVEHAKGSRVILGSLVTLAGFATVVGVFLKNQFVNNFAQVADKGSRHGCHWQGTCQCWQVWLCAPFRVHFRIPFGMHHRWNLNLKKGISYGTGRILLCA